MILIALKTLYILAAFGFVHYGLDTRKKQGMEPFTSGYLIFLMKVSCLLLLVKFIVALLVLTNPYILAIALLFSGTGVFVIYLAKKELGDNFTWTGHYKKHGKLVTSGVYAFVRNPLYSGVFLVETGYVLIVGFAILSANLNFFWWVLAFSSLIYAISFNLIMAKKEEIRMYSEFPEYSNYAKNVPAFFPRSIRPYEKTSD